MGTLRLLLAVAVLFQHVGQFAGIQFIDAGVAVFSFFVVSGFYMAMVLDTKYVGKGAVPIFYANRYARLWPTYAISLLIAFTAIWVGGNMAGRINSIAVLPREWGLAVVLSNLSFVGLDGLLHISLGPAGATFSQYGRDPAHNGASYLFNLPAWTIWIELMFYLVAPFVIRSLTSSFIFMLAGLAYAVSLRFWPQAWMAQYRYDMVYLYFITFFGLGAVVYWLSRNGKDLRTTSTYLIAAATALAFLVAPLHLGSSFYLLLAIGIPTLFDMTRSSKVDNFLGDLSYPIYILHIPVRELVYRYDILPSKPVQVFAVTLAISVIVVLAIERPIARARERWTSRKLAALRASQDSTLDHDRKSALTRLSA